MSRSAGQVPNLARRLAIPAGLRHINVTVVTDDEIVAAETVGDDRRFAVGVVRQNLLRCAGDGVQLAVGPK